MVPCISVEKIWIYIRKVRKKYAVLPEKYESILTLNETQIAWFKAGSALNFAAKK